MISSINGVGITGSGEGKEWYIYFLICSEFCHTLKWNVLEFTCLPHPNPPSHRPLHPLPPGPPRYLILILHCTHKTFQNIKPWNIMPKNVKLLEGNIGGKWYDMGFGNNFLDIKSKAQQWKRGQVGQCKIKGCQIAKEIINRVKGHLYNGNIFSNHISDKLMSKIKQDSYTRLLRGC